MGGRSTYGICLGALSWLIEDGQRERRRPLRARRRARDAATATTRRARRGASCSTWTSAATTPSATALEAIFTGRLRGSQIDHFPWAWKASQQLAVRPAAIEIEHVPGRGWFRAGKYVEVRVAYPVPSRETVTCVIPGHERTGREVLAESLEVHDGELEFAFRGNCGYESDFDYRG